MKLAIGLLVVSLMVCFLIAWALLLGTDIINDIYCVVTGKMSHSDYSKEVLFSGAYVTIWIIGHAFAYALTKDLIEWVE
jgi:hypothetical protein